MKLLKYILLFIFSLLLNRNVSATEIVVVESQNVFFEVSHNQTVSKEDTWLGLLYLQENSKLATSNDKIGLSCKQPFLSVNPNTIDSWKKLLHVDIPATIRTNPTYLSAASKQIDNYGSQIPFQFERVLPHVDAADYNKFFAALDNPKSIDHVRSLVGDFENIPGINLTTYTPNGLPEIDIPAPNTWADSWLALPAGSATTFTNATAKTLSPGTKIYRVIGDNYPAGGSWAYELPTGKADFFGNYGVRPEWNGTAQYVEFTVPSGGLKVWDGAIAKQSVLNGVNEAHFIGGKTQIYVPEPYRQVDNAFDNLILIDLPW